MKVTLVHPCIGRRAGQPYIRTWQMEPLPPAVIAGLTPPEVAITFHGDRMEAIPYDEPTDLVAISVETYNLYRQAGLSDRQRVSAARRSGGDGGLSRHALPGGGRPVCRGGSDWRG